MSYRITTKFIDLSETVQTSFPVYGATAIIAPKGPGNFYFFPKGSSQKIIDAFGYPSATYPQIQDAIDFNNKTSLFLASPSKTGNYGGVFVTKMGTIPFVNGVTTQAIADYSEIACTRQIGIGNGVQTAFTLTLPSFAHYINQSVDITVNGTTINVSASDADTEVLTTDPNVGSGTYVRETGVLSFTFATAPLLNDVIVATYNIDLENDVYFTLYDKFFQADDIQVLVTHDDDYPTDPVFNIAVYRYNPVEQSYFEIIGSPIQVSLSPSGKDGYGNNIYIQNIFNDDQLLFTATVQTSTYSSFTDDTIAVSLYGGSRGASIAGSDLATTYTQLNDTNKYPLSIIFDGSGEATVATALETLRTNYQKYCRIMIPTANLSPTAIIANPLTAANNTTNRGIYYYCLTWGTHTDVYQGNDFVCSNMGLIAGKMADILIYGPGGQPAWIDENGLGGQLGSAIVKLNYNANEEELRQLDAARLNPVTINPEYGPMIMSWRTRQTRLSDYSYISQSSLADYVVNIIEKQVLPYQIGKLNDDFHRNSVKMKSETVISLISKWLEESYVLCDRSNNGPDVIQAQKFVLTVGVIFKGYANTIEFNFVAGKQGISIEEQIKKNA